MTGTRLSFIIHEHATDCPHYDLRLRLDGGVKSWIIPKALPLSAGDEKRLAVEDWGAPAELISASEGIIADGYGVGEASIWDAGAYEICGRSRVRLDFEAWGGRLRGGYVLLLPGWGTWGKRNLWVLIRR
ncbi:MAG: DNA polymerase ligase N-terminal domain-containing protein [Deltaproteobacteria bacterium]